MGDGRILRILRFLSDRRNASDSRGMRYILLLLALFVVSCTMYEGLSMKPHKTSVTTTYGQDEVDKANDSKDQTKNSMQITVKQEFLWRE